MRYDSWLAPLRELMDRREQRWGGVLLLLAVASTVVEMLGATAVFALLAVISGTEPVLALPVVGEVALPGAGGGEGPTAVAVALLVFFVLRSAFLVGRAYLEARIVSTVTVGVAERLLDGYLAMPYLFHTRRNSSELMRNTFTSTQQLGGYLNQAVLLLTNGVLAVGLTALVVVSDPLTALVAVVALGSGVVVVQRFLQPRLEVWGRLANEATAGSLQAIQQALGGIRDIKVLGTGPTFARAHAQHRRRVARSGYLSSAGMSLPRSLIELGLVATVLVALIVASRRGAALSDFLPTLGLFAYAGIRLQPALQLVVGARNTLRYQAPIMRDLARDRREIDRWLRRPHAMEEASVELDASVAPSGPSEVRLEAVSFSYDEDGIRPALSDIDLTIRAGTFVGICGPTGGGKSTLLDALIGLLEPTSGRVLVDDVPLPSEPSAWWSQLGVVSQQVFLTDDTLRANVAFGIDAASIDGGRLDAAVRDARLLEVVDALPLGLDTVVGERGVRLSGGQRQRVALARALYRDTPFLILDEGTSALDTATEAAVMASITGSDTRTVIAVAHRLSTIRRADLIAVMVEGRLVAQGDWERLSATSPEFQDLLRAGDGG